MLLLHFHCQTPSNQCFIWNHRDKDNLMRPEWGKKLNFFSSIADHPATRNWTRSINLPFTQAIVEKTRRTVQYQGTTINGFCSRNNKVSTLKSDLTEDDALSELNTARAPFFIIDTIRLRLNHNPSSLAISFSRPSTRTSQILFLPSRTMEWNPIIRLLLYFDPNTQWDVYWFSRTYISLVAPSRADPYQCM